MSEQDDFSLEEYFYDLEEEELPETDEFIDLKIIEDNNEIYKDSE